MTISASYISILLCVIDLCTSGLYFTIVVKTHNGKVSAVEGKRKHGGKELNNHMHCPWDEGTNFRRVCQLLICIFTVVISCDAGFDQDHRVEYHRQASDSEKMPSYLPEGP